MEIDLLVIYWLDQVLVTHVFLIHVHLPPGSEAVKKAACDQPESGGPQVLVAELLGDCKWSEHGFASK